MHETAKLAGRYSIICYDKDGMVKWARAFSNLWTTLGRNDVLNQYLAAGTVPTIYMGLITTTGYSAIAAGDSAAQINGTNGWKEATSYSNGTRPAVTFAAASGASITSNAVAFTINASDTICGGFLITNNTISGTAGVLLTEGIFNETGVTGQAVINGDTLNVTWTGSM